MDKLRLYDLFRGIVKSDSLTIEDHDLVAYSRDYQRNMIAIGSGYKPDIIVRPRTTDQVSAILTQANQHKIPVVPCAGRTSWGGGTVPVKGGIVLDLISMDKIIEINREGMWVCAQPGVFLTKLESQLEMHGLMLGHDPASQLGATIGGAIATDGSGIWKAKYGSVRDMVLGLEVVLPTGRIVRTKPVEKSSSGYSLKHLFIGSAGTLGVITEATLLTNPLPQFRYLTTIFFDDFDSAFTALKKIAMADLNPSICSLSDRVPAGKAPESPKGPSQIYLAIGLSGAKKVVEAQKEAILEIGLQHGGKEASMEPVWWAKRHEVFSAFAAEGLVELEEVVVPLNKVKELHEFSHILLAESNLKKIAFGISLKPLAVILGYFIEETEEGLGRYKAFQKAFMKKVLDLDGTLSSSHGIGMKAGSLELMQVEHGSGLEVMKKIKAALDPNNIMNPGKWI